MDTVPFLWLKAKGTRIMGPDHPHLTLGDGQAYTITFSTTASHNIIETMMLHF